MAKNEIEGLLTEVLETEAAMNMDERDAHPNVRAAWAMRAREAKDRFPATWRRYREAVMGSTVAIFAAGNQAKVAQFAEVSEDEGGTETLVADELYQKMADYVEPLLGEGSRQLMPQHVSILFDRLHDATNELNVDISPQVRDLPVLKDRGEVVAFIRSMLRGCAGDSLNGMYIADGFAKRMKENRYKGGTIKAVVTGAVPEEIPGLGSNFGHVGATITVKADAEVNKQYVTGVFRQVNQRMKDVK